MIRVKGISPTTLDPLVVQNNKLLGSIASFRSSLGSVLSPYRPIEFSPLSYKDYCAFRVDQVEDEIKERCQVLRVLDDGTLASSSYGENDQQYRMGHYPTKESYYEFLVASMNADIDNDLLNICDLVMKLGDEHLDYKFVSMNWLNDTLSSKQDMLSQSTVQDSKVGELRQIKLSTYKFFNALDQFIHDTTYI